MSFLSQTFTVHRVAGDRLGGGGGGGGFHSPGDYCRKLSSHHSLQPGSKREPLVSKWKSLPVKLPALLLVLAMRLLWFRDATQRKNLILLAHLSKGVQRNILTAWNFTKNKHRCFQNSMWKTFQINNSWELHPTDDTFNGCFNGRLFSNAER